jgi:hypothetical protein
MGSPEKSINTFTQWLPPCIHPIAHVKKRDKTRFRGYGCGIHLTIIPLFHHSIIQSELRGNKRQKQSHDFKQIYYYLGFLGYRLKTISSYALIEEGQGLLWI